MTTKFGALADSVFLSVSGWVSKELTARLAPLKKQIDAMPVIKGDPGEKGADGRDGAPGAQGVPGADGARGAQGEPGKDGVDGPQGPQGPQGSPGAEGQRGADGERGADGPAGPQGTPGERGADGVHGKDGAPGPEGSRGADGVPGAAGPQGMRGERGMSAFEVAKESGFVGSEGEWLLSLRGASGIDGKSGQNGQDGRDGRDGERGERGRDALEMNVLDGIDETRSYARGTAAVISGGTFWAQRSTDPVVDGDYRAAGWLCMLRGIAAIDETPEDGGRILVRSTIFSDGSSHVQRIKTATLVHRGVFESGREYEPGDAVTYGGSIFVAQKTTKLPPGTSSDAGLWRLAVKRGKDGRDQ